MEYEKYVVAFIYLLQCSRLLFSIPIDNNVDGIPEVACLSESAKVAIQTIKPFFGHVYVKGQFRVPGCHLDLTTNNDPSLRDPNLQASRPTIIFEVPYRGCTVKRERTINPPGVSFSVPIVVQFHHQFLTKVDRAYTLTCFYMESIKSVTYGLDVSMIETTQIYRTRPMPVCTYEVLRGSLSGPALRFAQVGDMAFHKWSCQGAAGVYGILVHSCSATDGTGEDYKIIDAQGCAIDPVIVNDLTYAPDFAMAYVEVHVFKFADKIQLSIQCQISLCLLSDGSCNGITPPNCGFVHQSHGQVIYPSLQTTNVPQPPSAFFVSPLSPYQVYEQDSPRKAVKNFRSPDTLPSYVVFPSPPPSGRYLSGRRQHRESSNTGKIESEELPISNDKTVGQSRRFHDTIDLATDDIYIFNKDDQESIGGMTDGQNQYNFNISNVSKNIESGIDVQPAASSQCTFMSFTLSLASVALFFISLTVGVTYYQKKYYINKLIDAQCSYRSNAYFS